MRKKTFIFVLGALMLAACGGADSGSMSTPDLKVAESTRPPESAALPTDEPTAIPEPTAASVEFLFKITNKPDNMNEPYGVALNSEGNIYITDSGNSRVLIFDSEGNLLGKWDANGGGAGEFTSLGFGGLAIDSDDNVFVVDNGNYRIQKFDKDGNFLLQWGGAGAEDGQFKRAIGIATDKDGNVYVTDDANPFVQKFDNDGNFLMKWGGRGTGDGQFRHATGIAVDLDGNVFVADYENARVQKFDPTGKFIAAWGVGSDINLQGIPEAITLDVNGNVYVTDYKTGRIQIFDNDGNFLWAVGGARGPVIRPTGIALDARGRMFIVSQSGNNVTAFSLP